MSMPWFHVQRLPAPGEVIALDRDEAKHAMGVRRLGEGDGVTVFDGGGGVGPNLTDAYWLHGGTIGDLFRTIQYGVPAKGMKAWRADLTPIEIQNVSTYILSLQGTTPAKPKEPQGEWVAMADSTEAIAQSR